MTSALHVTNIEQGLGIMPFRSAARRKSELYSIGEPDVKDPEKAGNLSILLHRLLLGAAPGDVRLYPGLSRGVGCSAEGEYEPESATAGEQARKNLRRCGAALRI